MSCTECQIEAAGNPRKTRIKNRVRMDARETQGGKFLDLLTGAPSLAQSRLRRRRAIGAPRAKFNGASGIQGRPPVGASRRLRKLPPPRSGKGRQTLRREPQTMVSWRFFS